MTQQGITGLIEDCKNNDHKAFQKLVETHQGIVFRLAFRLLCNTEEAKDIVQETFIRVWKNLNNFDMKQKFATWLYKITSNLCYDKLKSTKYRINNHSIDLADANILQPLSTDNIEADYINNELIIRIKALTTELTPKQKLVFTLRDLEGLEISEIISITGQTAKKIKSNLYLARKQIREKIEKLDNVFE